MDIRHESTVSALSIGATPSRRESRQETSERWSSEWSRAAPRELSALERYELLGWDEV